MNNNLKVLLVLLFCTNINANAHNNSISVVSQNNSCIIFDFTLSNYTVVDTLLNPNYNVNQTFSYIHIYDVNYGIIDSLGWPQLPQLTFNTYLPYNATNITVSVSSDDYVTFSVPHLVLPQQEHLFNDTMNAYNFFMDSSCYNSSSWIYTDEAFISNNFTIFGATGVSLTIFPFSYNPSNSIIKACMSARITVNYILDDRIEASPRRYTKTTENYLNNFFENYSARSTNLSQERYLMIVDSTYKLALNRLANYKMNVGYDVEVVTTQETGGDVWSIKAYIQGLYDNVNTRPEYVLLAGDANTIPISAGSDGIESDPITDLNYSRLDGDDYYADVFLGRFPINSTYQLNNTINKTIYTETNLPYDYDIVYLIAGDADEGCVWWWRQQFEKAHNYIVKNTFEPLGIHWNKYYQPTLAEVQEVLSYNPKYFIYSGHGYYNTWSGVSFTLYKTNIPYVNNTMYYPFVFAFACRTGDFYRYETYNECIGKSWVTRFHGGAVTYFGSSIKTTNNVDNTLEKHIFYNNFQNLESISAIVNNGKNGYWNSLIGPLSHRKWYMKSYNLLGDPSIQVNGIDNCFYNYVFYYPEYYSYDQTEYVANNEIKNESDYIIDSGSNVNWKAGERISLESGFHAKAGSRFMATVESCNRNTYYESVDKVKNMDITNIVNEPEYMDSKDIISFYPNPAINEIVLSYHIDNYETIVVSISNLQGKTTTLFSGAKRPGEYIEHYSLNDFPSGIYLISIRTSQNQYIKKIIKQ
jgi:hypothetical protein